MRVHEAVRLARPAQRDHGLGQPPVGGGQRGAEPAARGQLLDVVQAAGDLQGAAAAALAELSAPRARQLAADAERELVEWKKLKFMRERVGEDFSAMILSATKYGLFVELDDLFVEGLVPIQSLGAADNDYYTYRENTREILGERWGRKFTIGQRVRVLLERVDAVQKRLQFSILDEDLGHAAGDARVARPKSAKAAKKKDKGASSVPEFAARVARPTFGKAGKKKARGKKGKTSMQRQGGKPHPFPKKIKK